MIYARDLPGVDEGLALRVIAAGRLIAPIDTLDGDDRKTAIAILSATAADVGSTSRSLKSQRVGSAGVEYADLQSWFSDQDKATLRAMCGTADSRADAPVGSFPMSGLTNLWTEKYPI